MKLLILRSGTYYVCEPLPLVLFDVPHHERAFHTLIHALARIPNRVTTLSIDAGEDTGVADPSRKSFMAITHLQDWLVPEAQAVFRRLKTLRYHLVGRPQELDDCLSHDEHNLKHALESLVSLEDLSVGFRITDPDVDALAIPGGYVGPGAHPGFTLRARLWRLMNRETTLPCLSRLALWHLSFDPNKLCLVLARHATTLTVVELHSITLTDAEEDWDIEGIFLYDPPHHDVTISPWWLQVARACQALPRLQEFVLQNALGQRCLANGDTDQIKLSDMQVREVVEVAMTRPVSAVEGAVSEEFASEDGVNTL